MEERMSSLPRPPGRAGLLLLCALLGCAGSSSDSDFASGTSTGGGSGGAPAADEGSLRVEPTALTLNPGDQRPLKVYVKRGGAEEDVTAKVTWTVSPESVATVESEGATGVA